MPIKNRFADTHAEITAWRRHLHTIPELMFDLPQTSAFVEHKLRSFGLSDITTGIAQTGIVAVIEGKTNKSGRTIGLRADMDALPITEATGLEYQSKTQGNAQFRGPRGADFSTRRRRRRWRKRYGRGRLDGSLGNRRSIWPAQYAGASGGGICDLFGTFACGSGRV